MLQCVWHEREGGGKQDSVDCKTMWLVGEDPLGLGCDVDSVAGYIQLYCNVLENVDYCVDIVDSVDYCGYRCSACGREGRRRAASERFLHRPLHRPTLLFGTAPCHVTAFRHTLHYLVILCLTSRFSNKIEQVVANIHIEAKCEVMSHVTVWDALLRARYSARHRC